MNSSMGRDVDDGHSGGACGLACGVTLTVDDGNGGVESCSTTVTVSDTTPPVVTCSVSAVAGGGGDGDHVDERFLVSYSASDACGAVMTGLAVVETPCCPVPVSDGQIIEFECADHPKCELELDFEDGVLEVEADTGSLSVTATDVCGNTGTCTVDLCPPAGP